MGLWLRLSGFDEETIRCTKCCRPGRFAAIRAKYAKIAFNVKSENYICYVLLMILITALSLAFRNFAVFSGRASRSEYWSFVGATYIVFLVLYLLGTRIGLFFILEVIFALAVIVPEISIGVRRLHDTGRSGWFVFLGLIPFVGSIIVLVLMLLPGNPGNNRYGPARLPLSQMSM